MVYTVLFVIKFVPLNPSRNVWAGLKGLLTFLFWEKSLGIWAGYFYTGKRVQSTQRGRRGVCGGEGVELAFLLLIISTRTKRADCVNGRPVSRPADCTYWRPLWLFLFLVATAFLWCCLAASFFFTVLVCVSAKRLLQS